MKDEIKKPMNDSKAKGNEKSRDSELPGEKSTGNRDVSSRGSSAKPPEITPGLSVCAKNEELGNASCGKQVGTVDHLDGPGFIKLNKADATDGKHHWIPRAWVEKVDGKSIYLNKTQEEFRAKRLNELPARKMEKRAS